MHLAIIRKVQRAISVYQELGLIELASKIVRRIGRLFGHDDRSHANWLARKLAIDAKFDAENNIQTGGVEELFNFDIVGDNARHGLCHIASDPDQFSRMLQSLDINYQEFTFIDLGSGKGRAVVLAASFPFRRVIGVEFAQELHKIAQANVMAVKAHLNAPVELVCSDAAVYEFPFEPLVIYLFNPFESAVIRRVSSNAVASWKANPRPMRLVYMNPIHLSHLTATGWQLRSPPGIFADLVPTASC